MATKKRSHLSTDVELLPITDVVEFTASEQLEFRPIMTKPPVFPPKSCKKETEKPSSVRPNKVNEGEEDWDY